MDLIPIICNSFEEYYEACSRLRSQEICLPILRGSYDWNCKAVFGTDAIENPQVDEIRKSSLTPPSYHEQQPSWTERCRIIEIAAGCLPTPTKLIARAESWRVLVRSGPEAICAALLGGAMRVPVIVTKEDLVESATDVLDRHSSGGVILVAPSKVMDDNLLFNLLDRFQRYLNTDIEWNSIPHFCLVTGTDLASISWVVAKIIATSLREPNGALFRHCSVSRQVAILTDLKINSDGSEVQKTRLSGSELSEAYKVATDVCAFQTHGFDSCATGGSTVVLCGKRSNEGLASARTGGQLACGYGYSCPRGPAPISLSQYPSKVLMLGTCNGLRLADSIISQHFNLGLSYLDGPGTAFVSSVFSSVGSDVASQVFLSAMGSGRSVAEAASLSNTALYCSNLERVAYMTIGHPFLTIESKDTTMEITCSHPPFNVNLGNVNFAELMIDHPDFLALASSGELLISCCSDTTREPSIGCFYRLEQSPFCNAGNAPSGKLLRVFIYRYPDAIGNLQLIPIDGAKLRRTAKAALGGLQCWLDFFRIVMPETTEEEILAALAEQYHMVRGGIARALGRLGIDGNSITELEKYIDLTNRATEIAQAQVLAHIVPLLAGPFWLTNAYLSEYQLTQTSGGKCPYCNGNSIQKRLQNTITSSCRTVVVCPKCSIISDTPEDDGIAEILISAPNQAPIGKQLAIEITLRVSDVDVPDRVTICPRLSTLGMYEILPNPQSIVWCPSTQESSHYFTFDLPSGLPPHHYFIKTLISSYRGLGFGARPVFVV